MEVFDKFKLLSNSFLLKKSQKSMKKVTPASFLDQLKSHLLNFITNQKAKVNKNSKEKTNF